MDFCLQSALGNRFLVIPLRGTPRAAHLRDVARVCAVDTGLAADGVALVQPSSRRLHIYNADGSRARVSGNGARCAAAWWFGHRSKRAAEVTWESDSGPVICARERRNRIAVTLSPPDFAPAAIPARSKQDEVWGMALNLRGKPPRIVQLDALSVGNPQAVVWVKRFPDEWRAIGLAIQNHSLFPDQTNVVFARLTGRTIDARIWERGAGETLSSGTGAAAVLVSAVRRGYARRQATVNMPGGKMRVHWQRTGPITLTCAVEEIAAGRLAVPLKLR